LIFNNPNIEKSCFFTATPKCANGIDMVKDCNLIYEYSYLRGLSEGYLNPFEIRCDLVGDDSNKTIYESIARAYYTTGNNRILTFHSDVNTESLTSVRNFVNITEMQQAFKMIAKEISKESNKLIKIPKIKMVGFYSEIKLKERRQILNEFDSCKDVYILCSCETMGEGVDTKNANMCVFVDSKTSVTKIIQNIGRVVRKLFGINKPHSTILLPMAINKTKYESCQTAEDCDAVIRHDMNKDGDFTSILNVLSALKQEDEDLYDICLHYPNEFSPQEIEENLKSQGYQIGEEVELDEVFERANINQHSSESDDEKEEEEVEEEEEEEEVEVLG
jgi:superfamily II DNA or RNA helicase